MNVLLVLAVAVVILSIVAGTVVLIQKRKKAGILTLREKLRQNLRLKVMYDEAKIDRLIEFEAEELRRKAQPKEPVENLMERAIGRWERDNASTASLY